jgi:hypothetical protein
VAARFAPLPASAHEGRTAAGRIGPGRMGQHPLAPGCAARGLPHRRSTPDEPRGACMRSGSERLERETAMGCDDSPGPAAHRVPPRAAYPCNSNAPKLSPAVSQSPTLHSHPHGIRGAAAGSPRAAQHEGTPGPVGEVLPPPPSRARAFAHPHDREDRPSIARRASGARGRRHPPWHPRSARPRRVAEERTEVQCMGSHCSGGAAVVVRTHSGERAGDGRSTMRPRTGLPQRGNTRVAGP